jgi:hypothetical protein
MVPQTESVSSRKRKKANPTRTTAFLVLLAFLAACALLWFGYHNLKPSERYARLYRAASLTTGSAAAG